MPAPIYLPQDQSAPGNIIGPAAQQSSQFLWQVLGQKMAQKRQNELMQAQRELELEKLERSERLEREKLRSAEGRTETTAKARILAAGIGAESREKSAKTTAEARVESAKIYAAAKQAAARLSIKYKGTKANPTEIQKFYMVYEPWYKKTFGEEKFKKDYPKGLMSVAEEYFKAKSSNLMSILLGGMMVGQGPAVDDTQAQIDALNKQIEEAEQKALQE